MISQSRKMLQNIDIIGRSNICSLQTVHISTITSFSRENSIYTRLLVSFCDPYKNLVVGSQSSSSLSSSSFVHRCRCYAYPDSAPPNFLPALWALSGIFAALSRPTKFFSGVSRNFCCNHAGLWTPSLGEPA